jgi:hypothetical protein
VPRPLVFSELKELDSSPQKLETHNQSQDEDSILFQTPHKQMDSESFNQKEGIISSVKIQKQKSGNSSPIAKKEM